MLKDWFINISIWIKKNNYALKYKLLVCIPIIMILLSLDWVVKIWVIKNMNFGETRVFIPNLVNLTYVINLGISNGLINDNVGLSIALATISTVLIMLIFIFLNNKKYLIPISIFLAGSLANLLGRIWTPEWQGVKGGVVDMLIWDFSFLGSKKYIFNVADFWVNLSIVIGILIAIIEFSIYIYNKKNKR